jgi:hypothetical protein
MVQRVHHRLEYTLNSSNPVTPYVIANCCNRKLVYECYEAGSPADACSLEQELNITSSCQTAQQSTSKHHGTLIAGTCVAADTLNR